jgi:predicted nucleic acid-binding protein
VFAVLYDEEGREVVQSLLQTARREGNGAGAAALHLPFIVLMELEYKLLRHSERVAEHSLALVLNWPVTVQESSPQWRSEAARIKASARVSVADAWIAGLALLLDAELVHKDPEFDAVPELRALRLGT